MKAQLTTSPELQLKLNSNIQEDADKMSTLHADEAARYIALCSMYANQRILDSEYYSQLAYAAASDRIQRVCPNDQGLWNKLVECKRVVEAWHRNKSCQGREESGQGSGVGGQ